MAKFYITTTLPYVNAAPHIGFALEIIQADVLARYHAQRGDEVIFNTGTDEHGSKIYKRALEEGKDPQVYVDEYAAKFDQLKTALNLSYNHFIRTTDADHKKAAQRFWELCDHNGSIGKGLYESKYCVGCELEKTDSELVDGRCPIHPNLEIEIHKEENYFFKFSEFGERLLALYQNEPTFVLPESRLNEIRSFVASGLHDFSISRKKSKMPWGVPVPGDDEHVMYVWFDALVNYISTLGWPDDTENFSTFWPGTQIAGKDNLRQQSAIWQAMLMAAGLPTSKQILIHGFINHDGQKMSKSLGNVVDPFVVVEKYGIDPVRHFLLREIPSAEDGDFSAQKLEARYNGDLANNLGNLVSRVTKLIATKFDSGLHRHEQYLDSAVMAKIDITKKNVDTHLRDFRLHEAVASIYELFNFANEYINDHTPWAESDPEKLNEAMINLAEILIHGAYLLWPFIPGTAEKIAQRLGQTAPSETWQEIIVTDSDPLFPRLSS